MTVPVLDMVPSVLPGVERALVDWLPRQRWFGGKGRPIRRVDLTVTAEFAGRRDRHGPCGLLAVADVHFADAAAAERYHVPLGLCRTPPGAESLIVTKVDGIAVSDATALPELTTELLGLIAHNAVCGSVRFASEPRGELAFAHRSGLRSRRSTAEQSNTSILFGDRFIMKLFRRLPQGVNPDLEVHRALSRCGSRYVAPLLGAIEGELDGSPVTYAMLQSFASDSTDGWELATAEVRDVVDGGGFTLFAPEAKLLGGAVAAVHQDLAGEFGVARLSAAAMTRLRDGLLAKLDAALAAVPALGSYAEFLVPAFTAVGDLPAGLPAQRIHGDLHLGQVLRTPARWLLVDFEGEPALPLADRVVVQPPQRDIAGMLRSFDYAAGFGVHSAVRPSANAVDLAAEWSDLMRNEFCLGYAQVAGVDPRNTGVLLRAYELEKLVYEAAYETRNRPAWARIPLRALRLLAGSDA
ncbi:MAG TPA: aminoglycoside phosphotransferase [Pseudonocardiaceae bacterium]|nr:aminoglycoside phosphotransferase [Pseudonocardiaceae bacterium]